MPTRIGLGDDVADAGLIEPLESLIAFQIFQMRADRSLGSKLLSLLGRDLSGGKQLGNARLGDRPTLALGERLPEVRKVGERLHHRNAGRLLHLLFERFKIKLAFEMVHTGLKECFAMKSTPQADGSELLSRRQRLMGEVVGQLLRRQIDVGKNDDAGVRLLQDLRSPARFGSSVK